MSLLFSSEFFGIVTTMAGCMLYTRTPEFSLFRTILAVLFTLGGVIITLKSDRKWLVAVHAAIWISALLLPILPKPLQNLFSVTYALSLIPFVLNLIRFVIRKLVGIEEDK